MYNKRMTVLDLFSGAGGLSEGFWKIGCRFAAHVEADGYACQTLKTRSAYWKLKQSVNQHIYNDYLLQKISRNELWTQAGVAESSEVIHQAISKESYSGIVKQIRTNMMEENIPSIDVLIGGPPCQAYSLIGRSCMGNRVHDDHRNYLYEYYIDFLSEFKPKLFVFENVPGLKNAGGGKYYEKLMSALRQEYIVPEPRIYNSSDFGVLQNRKRFIIVGWHKDAGFDLPEVPVDFPCNRIDGSTVADLLNDLPSLQPGESKNGQGKYASVPTNYLIKSGIRGQDFNILTHHLARPHNEQDRKIYEIAIKKWYQDGQKLKYPDLPAELRTHTNLNSFLDRFNVVKPTLSACHTMVAHISKDGHYYIHPDKNQKRSLSVREAARIQSFPDDFYFEGPRTAVFTQIGNAVPPLMAEQIAKKIKLLLN